MNYLPTEVLNHIKDYVIFKPKNREELQKQLIFTVKTKNKVLLYMDILIIGML